MLSEDHTPSLHEDISLLKLYIEGTPIVVQRKRIQLGIMRLRVRSLALLRGLRIQRCHELGCRSQMQLRSGVAVALAEAGGYSYFPLAWEPPYAMSVAPKGHKHTHTQTPTKLDIEEFPLWHSGLGI